MSTMRRRFLTDETGQDLIEYALLAALIATVSITALSMLGQTVPKLFTQFIPLFPQP